jgi:hypothetical protein
MLINPYAFFFGLAIARNRGLPANTATGDALVASVVRPTAAGLALVAALSRNQQTSSGGSGTATVAPQLTVAAASASQINLIWTAVAGADTYGVNRATKSAADGGKKKTITDDITDLSYSDSSLDAKQAYFYTVDAFDKDGDIISTSGEASATTDSSS